MIEPLFDRCIVCGQRAYRPGAGICWQHEVTVLIDLSYDRMRAALRGSIPVIGKRLQPASTPAPSRKRAKSNQRLEDLSS